MNDKPDHHGGERPAVNGYGTDDPIIRAAIEMARSAAAAERRRNRAELERYVERGLNEEDAASLVEFADLVDSSAAAGSAEGDKSALAHTHADLRQLHALTKQPDGAAMLAEFAQHLRNEAGDEAVKMPTELMDVSRFQAAGLSLEDAFTLAGFEFFLRQRLGRGSSLAETDPHHAAEHISHLQPRIYVEHADGHEHGAWIDAAREADELRAALADALNGPDATTTTNWVVRASTGFAGLDLTGYRDADLIAQLGRGVAEHGAAYVAFVELTGATDVDLLDRFDSLYVGSYASPEAWAREVGEDMEWDELLDRQVDPILRPYLTIDYARFARDQRYVWDIVEGADGRTHVFMR